MYVCMCVSLSIYIYNVCVYVHVLVASIFLSLHAYARCVSRMYQARVRSTWGAPRHYVTPCGSLMYPRSRFTSCLIVKVTTHLSKVSGVREGCFHPSCTQLADVSERCIPSRPSSPDLPKECLRIFARVPGHPSGGVTALTDVSEQRTGWVKTPFSYNAHFAESVGSPYAAPGRPRRVPTLCPSAVLTQVLYVPDMRKHSAQAPQGVLTQLLCVPDVRKHSARARQGVLTQLLYAPDVRKPSAAPRRHY